MWAGARPELTGVCYPTYIYTYLHTYTGSMHHSTSLHPLSAGTPGASVWPSLRQMMRGPFPSLRGRTFQAPTRRDRLRLTQGDCRLVDDTSAPPRHILPQSDPGRFSSHHEKVGVQKALPQSRHPVSCPADSSCTGGTPMECLFVFFRMKGFTVAGVQILPPTS